MIENYPDYMFEEAERREMENKSISEEIVEATLPYTLRPKSGDREKVIAAALEFIIAEYEYCPFLFDGEEDEEVHNVIDVKDIRNLIRELKETGTVEKVSSVHRRRDLDSL